MYTVAHWSWWTGDRIVCHQSDNIQQPSWIKRKENGTEQDKNTHNVNSMNKVNCEDHKMLISQVTRQH